MYFEITALVEAENLDDALTKASDLPDNFRPDSTDVRPWLHRLNIEARTPSAGWVRKL